MATIDPEHVEEDEEIPKMSQRAGVQHPHVDRAAEAVMRRAIVLASRGPARGLNPQVGCVVLDAAGAVIAEGWHRGSGTAHAEVDALSKLTAEQAAGSTLVVSLEPCNHTGKTGPCSQALIEANVARVIYAASDPGHASAGGAQTLRDAGIDVTGGVLAPEVNEQLHDWMQAAKLGRPFVTVKWASSLDGRAAAADGTSQWISGDEARERVHLQRSQADAIVVGTGTILADNPSLTARTPDGQLHKDQPQPVVLGERAIPADSVVYAHPHAPVVTGHRDIASTLAELRANGIRSVFVEGGPTLASAFIEAGFVDRFYIYLAPVLLGGNMLALTDLGIGTLTDRLNLELLNVERLGSDILIEAQPVPRTVNNAPPRKES